MNESSLYFPLCRVKRRITRLPDILIRPVTSEYRQKYFIEIPAAGTFRYFIVMEMDVRSGDVASCRKEGHDSSNANSPSACFLWRGFKEATVYLSLSLSLSLGNRFAPSRDVRRGSWVDSTLSAAWINNAWTGHFTLSRVGSLLAAARLSRKRRLLAARSLIIFRVMRSSMLSTLPELSQCSKKNIRTRHASLTRLLWRSFTDSLE